MAHTDDSTSSTGRAGRGKRSRAGKHAGAVSLSDALRQLTASIGIAKTLSHYNVLTSWGEIVGEQIARVSTPERIEHGTLFVSVNSAPWRTELSMRRLELLEHINRAVGRKIIKEIRFR
jgi:predicted nucleic acid-binding Zn ribbon protein